MLKGYKLMISEATGIVDIEKINDIEECMRNDIFHSTLDWQSRDVFIEGTKEAAELIDLAGYNIA